MQKEILLKQKIGLELAQLGMLSKVIALQNFQEANHPITPEQFTVLSVLIENDGLYQRQISSLTLKDRPNISRIISILENKNMITRKQESNGRQIFQIYITELGRKTYNLVLPTILKIWDEISSNISEKEIDDCLKILGKMKTNLKNNTNLQT